MMERLRLKFGSLALTVETSAGETANNEAGNDQEAAQDSSAFLSPRDTPEVVPEGPVPSTRTTRPRPKAMAATGSQKASYYVVFALPKAKGSEPDQGLADKLLGVHKCSWKTMCKVLPGGTLAGSGVQDCKKFATEDEAVEYYYRRHEGNVECKVHEYTA